MLTVNRIESLTFYTISIGTIFILNILLEWYWIIT
jgi:hypothetical protein